MVYKNKRLIVFLFLFTFLCGYIFITKKNEVKATITTANYVVCPTAAAGCDYVGGEGIQQAVNGAAATNTMTTIILKAGSYSRQTFNSVIYDSYGSQGKFFLDTKGKNITLRGENGAILDGANSAVMNGILAKAGSVIFENITINGFQNEPPDVLCRPNQTACSQGVSIYVAGTAVMSIHQCHITNSSSGIIQNGTSNIMITNNIITGNGVGITVGETATAVIKNNILAHHSYDAVFIFGNSHVTITNNTLFSNDFHGIYISSLTQSATFSEDPLVDIRNNIITDNPGNVTYRGVGIARYMSGPNKQLNSIISYNLIARNAAEATGCPADSVCTGTGTILNQDPKYENSGLEDFHLGSGSPAKGTGDPSLSNPNNSRSDMGAYGGDGACGLDSSILGCVVPLTATPIPTNTPAPTNTLIPTAACIKHRQGDANCDGAVDEVDFTVFKSAMRGQSICPNCSADFNGDTKVNLLDYEVWRDTFFH